MADNIVGDLVRGDKELSTRAKELGIMLWDRWPEESDRSWMAFQYYRDLGPGRTPKAVYGDFQFDPTTVSKWSTKFRWKDRTEAWDRHLDKIKQRAYEDTVASMGKRHAEMGRGMQGLGSEVLGEYASRPELKGQISVREAIDLTRVGVEIERVALAQDSKDKVGEGGGNVVFVFNQAAPKWLKNMSDRAEGMAKEIARGGEGKVIDAEIPDESR